MPSLGPLEVLVIFIVALLVFGPNKLPELARQVGKGLAEFRKVQHHLKGELDDAIHSVMDDDTPKVAPKGAPAEAPPPVLDAGSAVEAPEASVRPESGSPVDPGPESPPLADDA